MSTDHQTVHPLTRATIIIALFSLLSKLLGLLKFNILTSRFRIEDTLDIYFAAFRVPDFFFNLLILGTLSAAFIPVFCEYLVTDKERAHRFALTVLHGTALVMGSLSVLLFIFAPWLVPLVVPGFPSVKQELTAQLTRIISIAPFFFSVSSVLSGILNSYRRFTVVAVVPLVYNFSIIFGALVLYPFMGITGLAWGVAGGAFLHMLLQMPAVYQLGLHWRPVFELTLPGVRKLLRLFIPRVLTFDPGQVSLLISTAVGSVLVAGSVSVYNLAYDLQAVPLGIIGVSFATTAFPLLAHAAARADRAGFARVFNNTLAQILYLIIPFSTLMLVLRAHIVRLVFGRGFFDWGATIPTIDTFGLFTISLFVQCLVPLFARAFFALHNTVLPMLAAFVSIVVNVAAAFFLTHALGLGAPGLALAFSIASFVNLSLLSLALTLRFGVLVNAILVYTLQKIVAGTMVLGIASYLMLFIVEPFVDNRTTVGLAIQAGSAAFVGGVGYLATTFVLKVSESRHIVSAAKIWLYKLSRAFLKSPEVIE